MALFHREEIIGTAGKCPWAPPESKQTTGANEISFE
jgi:hypothetical protein